MKKMKNNYICQVCGQPTTWDFSVGYKEYIVCNECHYKQILTYRKQHAVTLDKAMADVLLMTFEEGYKRGHKRPLKRK